MKIVLSDGEKLPPRETVLNVEDVNYAIDGGLYAELLENRNFEAKSVYGKAGEETVEDDGAYAWEAYPAGTQVSLKIKTDRALFPENPHYMRIVADEAGAGVKNKAYDGIYLTKGAGYEISFYARAYDYKGTATAGVFENGALVAGKKIKIKADGKWRRYAFRVKCKKGVSGADFAFRLNKCGTVHADCFSMKPENAVLGVFRRDLIERLKELKPAVLRFPAVKETRFSGFFWKNTVGQTERRKHSANPWAAYGSTAENGYRSPYSHYGQTFGIGFFEYFHLAELLGAKPQPVVEAESAASVERCVQAAYDAVEFAIGGTDTVWGRVRAEMGHAQPFPLENVCVCGAEKERLYNLLCTLLKETYPQAGVLSCKKEEDGAPCDDGWSFTLSQAAKAARGEEIRSLPPFARRGYAQKSPALVWLDGETNFASADFYAFRMRSMSLGETALGAECDDKAVSVCASAREGMTFVTVVNEGDGEAEAEITGDYDAGSLAQITCLKADADEKNTFDAPLRIVPLEVAPASPRSATVPPRSVNVLVLMK